MPPSKDADEDELSEDDQDFEEEEEEVVEPDDGQANQKQSKKRKGANFIDDAAEEDDEEDEDEVDHTTCTLAAQFYIHAVFSIIMRISAAELSVFVEFVHTRVGIASCLHQPPAWHRRRAAVGNARNGTDS